MVKARVYVTLKPSVFDPQGKFFELELQASSSEQARTLAAEISDKVLANPVIESYRVEVE
jgi:phosphoribosylformylglycinamidine (FGAM) synthase PurS component